MDNKETVRIIKNERECVIRAADGECNRGCAKCDLLMTEKPGSFPSTNWVIMGAETGRRKEKVIPEKKWITDMQEYCKRNGIPVFMKDSLIPIVGEENMSREFPWEGSKDGIHRGI